MSDGTFWTLAIAATIVTALALTAMSVGRAAARPWPGDALFGDEWARTYFAGEPLPISPDAPRLLDDIAAHLAGELVAEAEAIVREAS